jgi:hypothetical protein
LAGGVLAFDAFEVGVSVVADSTFFTSSPDTLAVSFVSDTSAQAGLEALGGLTSCGLISSLKGQP